MMHFVEHGLEATKKWARTSSLRRHLGRKRSLHRSTHEAGTVSDGELASGKVSTFSSMLVLDRISDTSRRSSCASERPMDVGRVASWAAGFSILLEDPAGLHTFSEFLKKEFSQENIAFWVACERYRQLTDQSKMVKMAKEIYSKHLCIGAHEPVNVDSHARQVAQEGLESPTSDLFLPAQKQIFNLMKFDCYQRFLKSSMFKESMLCEMQGQPLPYQGQIPEINETIEKVKRKVNEDKKRKSLIPWHRLSKTKSNDSKNNRSKLWDRHCEIRKSLKKKKKERDIIKLDDTSSTQSDLASSRSSLTGSETGLGLAYKNISSRESLNSAELSLFPNHCGADGFYCRVILPDCSTTVVRTQKGETVGEMLLKLLERRCLTYNAVEAYVVGSHQPLDHGIAVTTLSCKEIRVEQVILFCLELPNKKTIGVKAKSGKLCGEILKPVLHKYGYKFDNVVMIIASSQQPVIQNVSITTIDNQRITVYIKDNLGLSDWNSNDTDPLQNENALRSSSIFPDLEELTNQIFDDLQKSHSEFQLDGLGVIDLGNNIDDKIQEHTLRNQISHHKSSHINDVKIKQKSGASNMLKSSTLEGLRQQGQNKALLPHNASKSNNSTNETSDCRRRVKIGSNDCQKLDISSETNKDHTLGKENCPLTGNSVKSVVNVDSQLVNKAFNSYETEFDFSLPTNLHDIDNGFGSDSIYFTHNVEQYFSNACYSHYDFSENSQSDRFLRDLGIMPSIGNSGKARPAPPPPNIVHTKTQNRPVSHSVPRPLPRVRPSTRSLPVNLQDSSPISKCPMSPTLDMESTLTGNESFELDLDVDITLKAHSLSDESISPSRVPFTGDVNTTAVNAEDAELSSSLSLENTASNLYQTDPDVPFAQLSARRLSEPPPVPPKAISRGPPPRPPSRQFMSINPGFSVTSEDDPTDDDSIEHGVPERNSQNQKCKSISIGNDYNDFNISFV